MHQQGKGLPVGGAYAIAILALVVAAAGGAYAAISLQKNSVKSKHIKAGQVKNTDLAGDAVTGPKIAPGTIEAGDLDSDSVDGTKVAADSLTSTDIAELTGADIAELTGDDIAELGPADIGELTGAELPIKWAFVGAAGGISPQSGGITLTEHLSGTGAYRLDFGTDMSNHAVIATPFNQNTIVSAGICGGGFAPQSVCPDPANNTRHVDVLTEDSTGANLDRAFYVVAIP